VDAHESKSPGPGAVGVCDAMDDYEQDEGALPVGKIAAGITVLVLVAIATLAVVLWRSVPPELPDVGPGAHLLPIALSLPQFELRDQVGAVFDRASLEQGWSLLFFGYTSCPDVCPTTLQRLASLSEKLKAPEPVRVVFVSIDPERDSIERMREYVEFFDPSFAGVTGDLEQLETLTDALGVYFGKRESPAGVGVPGAYQMDHSASLFLVAPGARLHALVDDPGDAAKLLESLRRAQAVDRGAS